MVRVHRSAGVTLCHLCLHLGRATPPGTRYLIMRATNTIQLAMKKYQRLANLLAMLLPTFNRAPNLKWLKEVM